MPDTEFSHAREHVAPALVEITPDDALRPWHRMPSRAVRGRWAGRCVEMAQFVFHPFKFTPLHVSHRKPGGVALVAWTIERVPIPYARTVVTERHYLHRPGPCTAAFGLFDEDALCRGIITYGVPASVPLVKGVLGPEHRHLVGELTRLWVDDDAPKNMESYLIGNTLRRSGFDVVVSFADTAQGHLGVVYQATNWLYTGLSSAHMDWELIGSEGRHTRHTWDEWGGVEGALLAIPERMRQVPRPRKHRYIFIVPRGGRRNHLRRLLRYPILPYPKHSHTALETSPDA